MNNHFRYNSLEFWQPLEYNPIFYRSKMPNPRTFLKKMSREEVVRLALLLSNTYVCRPASDILNLMSEGNWWKKYAEAKICDYVYRHSSPRRKYVVCFPQTILEILRYKFSMEPTPSSMREENVNSFEFELVKLITLINQKTMKFSVVHNENLEELMLAGIGYNKELQSYDYENQFKYQLSFAIAFFSFLEKQKEYNDLYKAFLSYYGISDWREYVCTILSLSIIGRVKKGVLDLSTYKDPDHLINRSILENISIKLSENPIPYKSKNEYDRKGNSDYKIFRDKPIFKIDNDRYVIYHIGFVLDRLYGSLFFDFKKIVTCLKDIQPNINNLFTSEFIEKHVFCGLMNECAINSSYLKFSEYDSEQQYKAKNGELGAPDYIVQRKDGTSAIIFECKDIKINAWVKEQRDYTLLEEELKNKIQLTTWELDYANECRVPKKKPKVKGVGQLAGHSSSIIHGRFKWGKNIQTDTKVYSVLVIADNRILIDGLAPLANRWYIESLQKENCFIDEKIRPLIIMSPLCLLKHAERFAKDGFEKYFEEYYKHIECSQKRPVDFVNRVISFDSFMDKYPYKLIDRFESIKKELLKGREHR